MELRCPECLGALEIQEGAWARCPNHPGQYQVLFRRERAGMPLAPAPGPVPPGYAPPPGYAGPFGASPQGYGAVPGYDRPPNDLPAGQLRQAPMGTWDGSTPGMNPPPGPVPPAGFPFSPGQAPSPGQAFPPGQPQPGSGYPFAGQPAAPGYARPFGVAPPPGEPSTGGAGAWPPQGGQRTGVPPPPPLGYSKPPGVPSPPGVPPPPGVAPPPGLPAQPGFPPSGFAGAGMAGVPGGMAGAPGAFGGHPGYNAQGNWVPNVLAGKKCAKHPEVQATYLCYRCRSPICSTCAFSFPNGIYLCPSCASAPNAALGSKRRKMLIASFALAILATVGLFLAIVITVVADTNEEGAQAAVGVLFGLFCFIPSVVGAALGIASMEKNLSTPVSVWIATIWNGLMAAVFIVASVVGSFMG